MSAVYDFIDYAGEMPPKWDNDKRFWMAVCEKICNEWYFLLTMEQFAKLYQLKYPDESAKTIRDAYVFQYYSEMDYRGQKAFDKEISKRDTKLTPAISDGIEYLVSNAAEDREELFDQVKTLHSKRGMYMPKAEELEEAFVLGFNPSNKDLEKAFETISELIDFKNSVRMDPGTDKDAIEKENQNRDRLSQGIILTTMKMFRKGASYRQICESVINQIPFKEEDNLEVLNQLRIVCNNTRMPGNFGHTALEISPYN